MIGKINMLKQEKTNIEFEILDCDEGIGELLVSRLNEEKDVEFAAYKKEHPFDTGIKVVVRTKGKDALKLTSKVVSELGKRVEEMKV